MSAYQAALQYLYSFTDYERQSGYVYSPERFDLARVHRLLHLLGDPHRQFQSVHIAGTKGKGSTAAITASILQSAGYRTALYTSPHLHTFRERIQIDGSLMSVDAVVAGVARLQDIAPQVPRITTFELITALAFDHLAREHVEWAVIEVGMGGRLDATNVIAPAVSVITSISYDHMMYLGNTLGQIAAEKAGIIKVGTPVVSSPQVPEAQEAICRVADERNAPLTLIGRDWQWSSLQASPAGQRFAAWPAGAQSDRPVYDLALLGRHQIVNATTALAAVEQLRARGIQISDTAAHRGVQTARWPGRVEILGHRPWVIVDGAHNGDSMQKLRETIAELFSYNKMILVLGVSADKDMDRILDAILPAADHALVVQAHHPRAASPAALAERIAARGAQAQVVPTEQAIEVAMRLAGPDDLIVGTGSLFLVADLIAAWRKYTRQPPPPTDEE